jgi:hypothetical protein
MHEAAYLYNTLDRYLYIALGERDVFLRTAKGMIGPSIPFAASGLVW